jgi:arginase family enzyme
MRCSILEVRSWRSIPGFTRMTGWLELLVRWSGDVSSSANNHGGCLRTLVARGVFDGEQDRKLVLAGARELFGGRHLVVYKVGVLVVDVGEMAALKNTSVRSCVRTTVRSRG